MMSLRRRVLLLLLLFLLLLFCLYTVNRPFLDRFPDTVPVSPSTSQTKLRSLTGKGMVDYSFNHLRASHHVYFKPNLKKLSLKTNEENEFSGQDGFRVGLRQNNERLSRKNGITSAESHAIISPSKKFKEDGNESRNDIGSMVIDSSTGAYFFSSNNSKKWTRRIHRKVANTDVVVGASKLSNLTLYKTISMNTSSSISEDETQMTHDRVIHSKNITNRSKNVINVQLKSPNVTFPEMSLRSSPKSSSISGQTSSPYEIKPRNNANYSDVKHLIEAKNDYFSDEVDYADENYSDDFLEQESDYTLESELGTYDDSTGREMPDVTTPHVLRFNDSQGVPHLPDALIIGAKKAGTRALLEFLRLHPRVRAARHEVHFFDRHYHRGAQWYKRKLPPRLPGEVVVEKTPAYLVSPQVPGRVRALVPDVYLLLVVREPATRALSDYTQGVSKHNSSRRSFSDQVFSDRTTGLVNVRWGPVSGGLYARHLQRWLQYFPPSRVHVVAGERLVTHPASEMQLVEKFLNLPPFITSRHFVFNKTKGFPCIMRDPSTPFNQSHPSPDFVPQNLEESLTGKINPANSDSNKRIRNAEQVGERTRVESYMENKNNVENNEVFENIDLTISIMEPNIGNKPSRDCKDSNTKNLTTSCAGDDSNRTKTYKRTRGRSKNVVRQNVRDYKRSAVEHTASVKKQKIKPFQDKGFNTVGEFNPLNGSNPIRPRCLGSTKGREHPDVDQETFRILQEFYRPFNYKFFRMINRNLDWD